MQYAQTLADAAAAAAKEVIETTDASGLSPLGEEERNTPGEQEASFTAVTGIPSLPESGLPRTNGQILQMTIDGKAQSMAKSTGSLNSK
ncbi:unnamed protein product [Protopolystoma xenopodis]|uniref:Uncharacterized protein n=1 Tax=Protopolystoma xenopodis TaxID=117903 RepID=A0A3S5ALN1_9PLAT|nr:unnamed protein product [Protopolystoma xenopodis]